MTQDESRKEWTAVLRPARGAGPHGRVVAVPNAGAGPNSLLPLLKRLPDSIEVVGVTLPGRERRYTETFADTPDDPPAVVRAVLGELRRMPALPTVYFGHSMGSVLAAALALEAPDLCAGLVLSAPPDVDAGVPGDAGTAGYSGDSGDAWDEAALLDVVRRGGGTPAEVLADPFFRDRVLSLLRCDLTLGRRLARLNAGRALPVPPTVLTGEDDALVTGPEPAAWTTYASAGRRQRSFPGGHFYLLDPNNRDAVAAEISAAFPRNGATPPVEETFLICLPFAGAGASFFTPWQDLAPEGLRILPVQLPGREQRFVEPPHTDAADAVDEAYALTTAQLGEGARVAVFGHSLGAVLAYELAHRLEATPGVSLDGLVVSGSPGPWTRRADHANDLPDDEFVARVRTFAGYSHVALEDPEMRALLLPTLRADVRMHETYVPSSDRPLSAPITSVRGRDDELVSAVEAAQWAWATTGKLTTAELDGGHMYVTERAEALLRLTAAELRTARAR